MSTLEDRTDDRAEDDPKATGPRRPDPYARAKERAEALQGLYIHALVFVLINAGLFAINLLTRGDGGTWWFWWPLGAWGVGLVVHAATVFVPVFSPDWVERRAARMAGRDQRR